MNTHSTKTKVGMAMLAIALSVMTSHGQERYTQSDAAILSISGTSTMHNWTMSSKSTACEAVFETNAQGEPVRVASLTFTVDTESLKSGKSAMDKNAYNALKTDKNKEISFVLTSGKITGKVIQCQGKLTVAGTTKPIEFPVDYTLISGGSLQCKGFARIAMTDYNVEPPSFMFGSVTTGNDITVSFDLVLVPKKLQPITLN